MTQRKYTADIVRDYCEEYPDMPTNTMARMIHKNHPLDFPSVDAARAYVRKMRKEHGTHDYKDDAAEPRTEQQKKDAQAGKTWHEIPESDYKETPPFEIATGNNRVLVLSDIHIPYHDRRAIETAIAFAKKRKPNVIYLNGDIMDCYQGSRFVNDRRKRDLAGELDLTRQFLDYLAQEFPKAKIYYKIGNHEARFQTYLMTHAPALLGIDEFSLDVLLRFGERGIGLVEDRQFAKAGKLYILHGHELFKGFGGQVNPARTAFLRAMHSILVGHHHQTSEHTEKTIDESIITTYSMGCLCGLKPDYAPNNKYNHGFVYLETNGEQYQLENYRIVKGEVY